MLHVSNDQQCSRAIPQKATYSQRIKQHGLYVVKLIQKDSCSMERHDDKNYFIYLNGRMAVVGKYTRFRETENEIKSVEGEDKMYLQ